LKSIDELSKELYDEVMSAYDAQGEWNRKAFSEILDEKLQQYNDAVSPLIMAGVYDEVNRVFKSEPLPGVILKEPKLSNMLYNNKKRVQSDTIAILNDSIKAKRTIGNISKKLYDGYSFNDSEVLQVRKKLPRYLQRELKNKKVSAEFVKYVDNIKTKPLKTALKQISDRMGAINQKGLENAIRVALEEKSRYYATRIADTEHHRAVNMARAKSYLDDSEIEFVKHQMNSRHPMVDICDYYDKLDSGYGKGIYKKEDMITLGHHPWCKCRYIPHYDKVKKRAVKNPEKDTLESFNLNDRRNILGSHNKLQKFYDGESVESIFNISRPKYPVQRYGDVLGYNVGMKFLNKKNISMIEKKAIDLWSNSAKNAGIIKNIVKKNFTNLETQEIKFKDTAIIILNMFGKYDSEFAKNKPLYRGKSFYIQKTKDKELYNDYVSRLYVAHNNGTDFVPDDVFRSATKSKTEALKFSDIENKSRKSIVITYKKRISNELDISKISKFTSEDEILIQGKISYKVLELNIDKNKNIFVTLEEVK